MDMNIKNKSGMRLSAEPKFDHRGKWGIGITVGTSEDIRRKSQSSINRKIDRLIIILFFCFISFAAGYAYRVVQTGGL